MISNYCISDRQVKAIRILEKTNFELQDVTEIKEFLPVRHNEHDAMIARFANSAKSLIENEIRDYCLKTKIEYKSRLLSKDVRVPYTLQSVVSVEVDGTTVTDYTIFANTIELTYAPSISVTVVYYAGISTIPSLLSSGLKDAVFQLVKFFYDNKNESEEMPAQVKYLLSEFKRYD